MTEKEIRTVEVPVDLLLEAERIIRRNYGNTNLTRQLMAHVPKPPRQSYFVLYKVIYQPEVSADPNEETPPMDMTHSLSCDDPRFVTYEMENIGPLEHIIGELEHE